MGRIIAAVLLSFLGMTALFAAGNVFLPYRPLSANDLDVQWLRKPPGRFFVPEPGTHDTVLETSPQLARLRNKARFFRPAKVPAVFRIFCMGGSTTHGWPFQHILSYPDFLNALLKDVLPSRRVEVINAGFLSSKSVCDIPLLKELLGYQSDLIIIYERQNETPIAAPLSFGLRAQILALAHKSRCLIMFMTQVRDPIDPSDGPEFPAFNAAIKRLGTAQGVPAIDAEQAFKSYRGPLKPIFSAPSLASEHIGILHHRANGASRAGEKRRSCSRPSLALESGKDDGRLHKRNVQTSPQSLAMIMTSKSP